MIYKLTDTSPAVPLFGAWEETTIRSCIQGVMGSIYADDRTCPTAAAAALGDFIFFAGTPSDELIAFEPDDCNPDFMIMVPRDESWEQRIEKCCRKNAKKISRYAMKKEPHVFDQKKLQRAVKALPQGYELRLMDEELYKVCKNTGWSRDLVRWFGTYERYRDLGLGVVLLKNGTPVSGASSYSRYLEGIEIEIDTWEPYRRRGFAYTCGARLILECLARGLYPSWDAHNLQSAALAEKLGYHQAGAYTAYEVYR